MKIETLFFFIFLSLLILPSCSSPEKMPFNYSSMSFEQKREFIWKTRSCDAMISKLIYAKFKDTLESVIGDSVTFFSCSMSGDSNKGFKDQFSGFMINIREKNIDSGKIAAIGCLKSKLTGTKVYNIEFFLQDTLNFTIKSVEVNQ